MSGNVVEGHTAWSYIKLGGLGCQRAVSGESTNSHTRWKWASEMESSEGWSVVNQQVHILAGNKKTGQNGQQCDQCAINKFTYQLEMKNEKE